MAKDFTFRGKTLEELRKLSEREFAQLCNARARRSLMRRGTDQKLKKKIGEAREKMEKGEEPKPIRTHKRDTVIVPSMIELKFGIHTGKEFSIIDITPEMLGHFLGEFVLTRKRITHGKAGIGATRSSTAVARK